MMMMMSMVMVVAFQQMSNDGDDGDDDDCDGNGDDDNSLVTKRLKLEFLSQRWQSHSEHGVKEFIVRCKEGEGGDDENIAEIVNFCEIRKLLV